MMHHEFEELAGYEVSYKTYTEIIEPMYMATKLSKQEFIKTLNRKAFEMKREPNIKVMCVRDRSGYSKTPNGCYYHIQYVDLVDVDIKTGKFMVAPLSDDELCKLRSKGKDVNLGYGFDFDYTQCVDLKRKPVKLSWTF